MNKRKFVFSRSVMALILREMSTTYGRSPGGYFWALVEPVGGIVFLTLIFSLISRTPALGTNFPLYFASGILPFMLYQSTAVKIGQAIRYSRPLLAYPSVTYVDALVARLILNGLTQLIIIVLLFGLIIVVFGLRLNMDYLTCLHGIFLALILGFGVGTVNCYMMSRFPLWQVAWGVLNRPLFIISGIFFLIDPLPEHIRSLLLYNPIAHPIMVLRRGVYDTYDAVYASEFYVYMVALSLSALGLLLLRRHHRVLLDEGV